MFPSDDILLARGKYSTLSKDRRSQLKRAQAACTTLLQLTSQTMRGLEQTPPVASQHIVTMGSCLKNIDDANERIANLCAEMSALEDDAWGTGGSQESVRSNEHEA